MRPLLGLEQRNNLKIIPQKREIWCLSLRVKADWVWDGGVSEGVGGCDCGLGVLPADLTTG